MKTRRQVLLMIAFATVAILMSCHGSSQHEEKAAPVTVVYLLRHAEKDTTGSDPGLTATGQARAEALATMLQSEDIAAIYSTPFRRTHETVAPLAERLGEEIQTLEIDPKDIPGHAESVALMVRNDHPGDHLVIVGHSNTVPVILRALGVPNPPVLNDPDYGDLFAVVLSGQATPTLLHLRFGDGPS